MSSDFLLYTNPERTCKNKQKSKTNHPRNTIQRPFCENAISADRNTISIYESGKILMTIQGFLFRSMFWSTVFWSVQINLFISIFLIQFHTLIFTITSSVFLVHGMTRLGFTDCFGTSDGDLLGKHHRPGTDVIPEQ